MRRVFAESNRSRITMHYFYKVHKIIAQLEGHVSLSINLYVSPPKSSQHTWFEVRVVKSIKIMSRDVTP
jgi:hypothetical protein